MKITSALTALVAAIIVSITGMDEASAAPPALSLVNVLSPKTSAFTVTDSASYLLSVTLAGKGRGAVNSNPTGIACTSGTCQSAFPQNSVVYLMAYPDGDSTFSSWSGCVASANCSVIMDTNKAVVTMDADKAVTANFARAPYLRVRGTNLLYTFFSSLQQALQSTRANLTIEGRSVTLLEEVIFNRPGVSLWLRGGFDPYFETDSGMTTVKGKLVIRNGSLRVERMVVQ